jgi:hypothetical protein
LQAQEVRAEHLVQALLVELVGAGHDVEVLRLAEQEQAVVQRIGGQAPADHAGHHAPRARGLVAGGRAALAGRIVGHEERSDLVEVGRLDLPRVVRGQVRADEHRVAVPTAPGRGDRDALALRAEAADDVDSADRAVVVVPVGVEAEDRLPLGRGQEDVAGHRVELEVGHRADVGVDHDLLDRAGGFERRRDPVEDRRPVRQVGEVARRAPQPPAAVEVDHVGPHIAAHRHEPGRDVGHQPGHRERAGAEVDLVDAAAAGRRVAWRQQVQPAVDRVDVDATVAERGDPLRVGRDGPDPHGVRHRVDLVDRTVRGVVDVDPMALLVDHEVADAQAARAEATGDQRDRGRRIVGDPPDGVAGPEVAGIQQGPAARIDVRIQREGADVGEVQQLPDAVAAIRVLRERAVAQEGDCREGHAASHETSRVHVCSFAARRDRRVQRVARMRGAGGSRNR